MTGVAVAVDVGGTKIAGALVAADGATVHHSAVPTPRSERGADPSGRTTSAVIAELLAHARADRLDVVGVGLGVPEYVDPHGRISSSVVLAWDAEPATWITSASSGGRDALEVVVESDVRCAAIAETRLGRGRGAASCLYVTVGTGISHTFVVDGRVWSGHRGEAIAFGELPVGTDDCLLPNASPTVEGQASGLALEGVAAGLGLAPSDVDDPRLQAARSDAGRVIARALVTAVAVLDPEVVVLGGGLGTSTGAFSDAVDEHYRSLTSARPGAPPLLRSALGTRAGVIGAGFIVHDRRGGPG